MRLDKKDLVLALDCSTSGAKAVLFDMQGQCLSSGRRTFGMSRPGVGRHEQDAADWWVAATDAIRDCVGAVDTARIASMTVTHQRETFVCLNEAGEQVRPAIVWADNRSIDQVSRYGTDDIHRTTGRPADITPSIYKLIWLNENEPESLASSRWIGDVGAYLNYKLLGRWVSSAASADSLGLMDISTQQWAPDLCSLAGVQPSQLPELAAPGTVIGELSDNVAAGLLLPPGLPVIAGAGDGQCAAIGTGGTTATSMYLNVGTAIVAGVTTPDFHWSRRYRTVLGGTGEGFLLETLQQAGTYLVTWFLENFGEPAEDGKTSSTLAALEAAAASVPAGSDGLIALPYWNGAQTPHWNGAARGVVLGWTGSHGRAHFYRALLEGIAFDVRLGVDGIEEATGQPIREMITTGGGSRSPLWSQILADVTGRTVQICEEAETTALGAAALAAAGAGLYPDAQTAAATMSRISTSYSPRPDEARRYAQLFRAWCELYPATKDILTRVAQATSPDTHAPSTPSAEPTTVGY